MNPGICKVSAIVEELCGTAVSSTQVSDRPLGAWPYLVFDARYEKVRHDGQLRDWAVLLAMGIPPLKRLFRLKSLAVAR